MQSPTTPPSPAVVLDGDSLDQLNTPDAKALLDTIDSLREIHVGDIVNLPQIIVVGDQSSGKSSVLEAISGVLFPVDGDLCTRFATELILRRAPETAVNVSIQFAEGAASAAQTDALRQPFRRSTFNKRDLPDIIREAKDRMGIREGGAKKFSNDILRVEISASDVPSLTLVDLPGIFHSATADQDLESKTIVDQLIDRYMAQPKSIILTVVAANNQLANQLVLQKAQTHDPNRVRTIGVITKPDLAGSGSANERKYLELAKGRESMHKLNLGWYVLRNRSEAERSSETESRDAVEERFFRTGAWSSISPANRGVDSLRKKLSKVLLGHIKTSLPSLIEDITTNLRTRQESLDRLGTPRSTPAELRSYLLHITDEYQRLARDAIGGRYNDRFFGTIDEQEMKLRARLRNLNRAFGFVMANKGSRERVVPDERNSNSDSISSDEQDCPEYLRAVVEEYGAPDPEPISDSELMARLQTWAALNQGMEFPGQANSDLARQLFTDQAAPWHGIARRQLELALKACQEFVEGAFYYITGADKPTAWAIVKDCVEPFFEARREALEAKLEELLHPYTSGYSLPLEDDFRRSLCRPRPHRLDRQAAERLVHNNPDVSQPNAAQRLGKLDILQTRRDVEKDESDSFGCAKVIEMMETFYDISLRTFTDNVINLAVERCLVYHIPSLLTSGDIHNMTVEKLQELAEESEEVRIQRLALQDEVRILKEGLRRCQRHRPPRALRESLAVSPRPSLGVSDTDSRSPTPLGDAAPTAAAVSATQQRATPGSSRAQPSSTVRSAANTTQQPASSPTPRPQASPNQLSSTAANPIQAPAPTRPFLSAASQAQPNQTSRSSSIFSTAQRQAAPTSAGPSSGNGASLFGGSFPFSTSTTGNTAQSVGNVKTTSGSLFSNLTPSNVPSSNPPGGSGVFNTTTSSTTSSISGPPQARGLFSVPSGATPTAPIASAFARTAGGNNNNSSSNNNRTNGNGLVTFADTHNIAQDAGAASSLESLKYPGIEVVPLLYVLQLRFSGTLLDHGPARPGDRDRLCHVSSEDRLKGFSVEELRLRWMVAQGTLL